MTVAKKDDPSTESVEYGQMKDDRQMIADILEGGRKVRNQGTMYLPKYPGEGQTEYQWRNRSAPWRPEFADALRNLVARPFGRDIAIKGDSPPEQIVGPKPNTGEDRRGGFVDDVDGRGNSLSVFCKNVFERGIAMGMAAIFVDTPKDDRPNLADGSRPPPRTVAESNAANIRPYWIFWDAMQIIALEIAWNGGKAFIKHMRVKETVIERDNFAEKTIDQIRVLEPGVWTVYRKKDPDGQGNGGDWAVYESGDFIASDGAPRQDIPVALFFTGRVEGSMKVRPPLADLSDMQIELYRAGSRKDDILTNAGSPMLQGKGIEKEEGAPDIIVGPRTVLYAPMSQDGKPTEWGFLQPDAANITEIRNDLESIVEDIRRLGMQPAIDKSGNPTATSAAIDNAKTHSTLQSWAMVLNDTIEQAMVYTTDYYGIEDRVQTHVDTDFAVLSYNQPALVFLQNARDNKDISQGTYLETAKRFGVLAADLDVQQEIEKTAQEIESLDTKTIPLDPNGDPLQIARGSVLV